jgi:uncharacterized protein YdeI (YjbR/CyaY-like superfamily)
VNREYSDREKKEVLQLADEIGTSDSRKTLEIFQITQPRELDATRRSKNYMEQEKKSVIVPEELSAVLKTDSEAKVFFEGLTDGYKRGYCDWVGGAKQEATRQIRAEKALTMLQNKQKTLKT